MRFEPPASPMKPHTAANDKALSIETMAMTRRTDQPFAPTGVAQL